MFTPFSVIGMWIRSLLSLILIAGGAYLFYQWNTHRVTETVERVTVPPQRETKTNGEDTPTIIEKRVVVSWSFGFNRETAFLLGGVLLLTWSVGGGWGVYPRLFRRRGADEPKAESTGQVEMLRLADGSQLRIEITGSLDAHPIVLTHGWGLDKDEWYYARKMLGSQYKVVTWDLPGLGKSDRPMDRDWSMEKLAAILDVVISEAGPKPVTLVGHSIGGMITLTYCKLYPAVLGSRVRSLVIAHSTYTNPAKTAKYAALHMALQNPVTIPLCYLMIWLSPLVRVMNWLSYFNGSAHRSTDRNSFSGKETRGQLDFMTSYYLTAPPDVIGHGMLAMMRYDATQTLGHIPIPTLVVSGDNDEICLPEASQYMASHIPQAQLVTLKKSRHCGLFEHPQAFINEVHEFLRSHPPES